MANPSTGPQNQPHILSSIEATEPFASTCEIDRSILIDCAFCCNGSAHDWCESLFEVRHIVHEVHHQSFRWSVRQSVNWSESEFGQTRKREREENWFAMMRLVMCQWSKRQSVENWIYGYCSQKEKRRNGEEHCHSMIRYRSDERRWMIDIIGESGISLKKFSRMITRMVIFSVVFA